MAHQFVDYIPDSVEDGTVYVCIPFATVLHRCCCGCGMEVVTPLTPTDWKVTYDGQSISLDPSVGNWSYPCQSHYWIRNNQVVWARSWSTTEIEIGRRKDAAAKAEHFNAPGAVSYPVQPTEKAIDTLRVRLWKRLTGWLG
jgi:hypothetical protein